MKNDLGLEWRPVAGCSRYEIRQDGALRRVSSVSRWSADRVLKPFTKPGAPKRVVIGLIDNANKRVLRSVAELVATAFLGSALYARSIVEHLDGNTNNLHVSNLRWIEDAKFFSKDAEWVAVKDFPDYEVSDQGQVRRAVACIGQPAGRILKSSFSKEGYDTVKLYCDKEHLTVVVHRLVARAFLEAPPAHQQHVAHNDGNRKNNRKDNLRWATSKENMSDRVIHGTAPIGEQNAKARLTAEIVADLRKRAPYLAKGELTELARSLDVDSSTLSNAIAGRTWKHL